MGEKKYILVLGGSTFMGLQLLQKLCSDENEEYQVYYINRGKKYWNNQVKNIKNAYHIFGNRKEKKEYQKLIEYESKKLGIDGKNNSKKWTAVYDFCAFKYSEVQIAYEALKNKCELYVFISTDSVYDVCDKNIRQSGQPIKEEMACRPTTLAKIEKYKKDDEYAHNKLKCEEYLYNYVDRDSLPFIILRLPDVIGPYDDTGRFWAYMKWISEYSSNPLLLDQESKKQKMSFVFSSDVAQLCCELINKSKDNILYTSYNIGFDQYITLKELIIKIGEYMGLKQLNLKDSDSASSFYPSVDCGPIDISKAQNQLGWNPTNLDDALKTTVNFFLTTANNKYKDEESYAIKKLYKKIKTD